MKIDATRGKTSIMVRIWACGCACAVLLQLALYMRPGPLGVPFVLDRWNYLPAALFFTAYGVGLSVLPFWLGLLVLSGKRARALLAFGAALAVGALLAVDHINHELQRFMGIRLSPELLAIYHGWNAPPSAIISALGDDRGGPWSSLGLLAVPLMLFPWLLKQSGKLTWRLKAPWRRTVLGALGCGLFLAPAWAWHIEPGSQLRKDRVAPSILALAREIGASFDIVKVDPDQVADDAANFRRDWLAADRSGDWTFGDLAYPYWRSCKHPATSQSRSNVVLIVLETFRAKNMRSFNAASPELTTPFLDTLTANPASAFWPRYHTNGVPTAYAVQALMTGIPPHNARMVWKTATGTRFDSLPSILRKAGYHTAYYSGSDPDWDNQRYWFLKWFDAISYHQEDQEQDRHTFRRAARDLMSRRQDDRPFLLVIQSITNHVPFRLPESRFAGVGSGEAVDRINATMRYTDDVVREFVGTLSSATWFEDTIFVITGDHGFDLGDRGSSGSLTNLRPETTWVPLIIYRPAGLPIRGAQPAVGSHIDLGPTILGLLGICDKIAAAGHDLLTVEPALSQALVVKNGAIALATSAYSLYLPPEDGAPMLYAGDDALAEHDLAALYPEVVRALSAKARGSARLNDALIASNRIRP
ncbi:LTA synthase family protein [Novosphingobium aquae]|uniref:LTA synthase family protein n=1 Tax=Novosphingobium aquae TaxID=3133435 RepID=A0ABU8S6Z2_9SPHN